MWEERTRIYGTSKVHNNFPCYRGFFISHDRDCRSPSIKSNLNKGAKTRKIKPLQNVFNYILWDVQSVGFGPYVVDHVFAHPSEFGWRCFTQTVLISTGLTSDNNFKLISMPTCYLSFSTHELLQTFD